MFVNCIIPFSHGSVTLGGWDKSAVLLDPDLTFDIQRFYTLLQTRLKRLLPDAGECALQILAQNALSRLHIFQPKSSSQIAVTIWHLPNYFATRSPQDEVGLLGIDSVGAFHWPDRYTAQQMQLAGQYDPQPYVHPLRHVLSALQSFRLSHGPVIVLNNWGLTLDPNSSSSAPLFKQHLNPFPTPFASMFHGNIDSVTDTDRQPLTLTHHITLSLPHLQPYPLKTTVQTVQTLQADEKFDKEIELYKTEIIGVIRTPGNPKMSRFSVTIQGNDIIA
ncbi:hypothetical protein AX17_000509 [Amanita inopinata Kibby_2008]|nr:hypothetical protein AX17_000509 [Amanita inopinata Kibby_2008]